MKKLAYQGRSIAVWLEQAQLPNGRTAELDVVRHPGASAVVPFESESDVLLIRQYRHGTGEIHVEIPGGMVDPGEEPLRAAQRELREETGYAAPRWRCLGAVAPNPAILDNRLHIFLAEDAEPVGSPELDSGEVVATFTAPLTETYAMVKRGAIDHALVVAAFAHLALDG